jgi:hypothetical protein
MRASATSTEISNRPWPHGTPVEPPAAARSYELIAIREGAGCLGAACPYRKCHDGVRSPLGRSADLSALAICQRRVFTRLSKPAKRAFSVGTGRLERPVPSYSDRRPPPGSGKPRARARIWPMEHRRHRHWKSHQRPSRPPVAFRRRITPVRLASGWSFRQPQGTRPTAAAWG